VGILLSFPSLFDDGSVTEEEGKSESAGPPSSFPPLPPLRPPCDKSGGRRPLFLGVNEAKEKVEYPGPFFFLPLGGVSAYLPPPTTRKWR